VKLELRKGWRATGWFGQSGQGIFPSLDPERLHLGRLFAAQGRGSDSDPRQNLSSSRWLDPCRGLAAKPTVGCHWRPRQQNGWWSWAAGDRWGGSVEPARPEDLRELSVAAALQAAR
jgi:hypothetical protein